MPKVITYCEDTTALVAELAASYPHLVNLDDPENPAFLVPKTPTIRNGNKTLALVRADSKLLEIIDNLTHLVNLGTYDEIFNSPSLLAVYDSVYDRTPYTVTEENGSITTVNRPDIFGAFAS